MKKKILVLLLLLTIVCTLIAVVGCNDIGNQYFTFKLNEDNESYTFTGITPNEFTLKFTSISIPSKYKGLPVTAVGYDYDYRLEKFEYLKRIEIPRSVTSIGERSFKGCSSLASIEIPSGVTSIGENAFYGCRSLTSIEIPSSVTSIEHCAFYGCSSLTSIEIPNTVERIRMSAFAYCSSLTSIVIPSSVTSIGNSAFFGCDNLSKITLPSYAMPSAAIGEPIRFINLFGFGDVPSTLKEVIISSGSEISNYAFQECSSLTSIVIPSSVTRIGSYAFQECSSLTSIEIPSSVMSIGEYAFQKCSNLTIYCETEKKPNEWDDNWNTLHRYGYFYDNGIVPVVWGYKG